MNSVRIDRKQEARMSVEEQAPEDASSHDREHSRDAASDDGTGSGAPPDPYRILIVEDDRSQALFAEGVLHAAGMRTQWVAEPDKVLPAIAAFTPDLVLMDLHLADTSGTDLTAAIRADGTYAQLPIVFLTGDPDPETEYRVLDSGADDFLVKPIRPRHLISAVSNRVARARLARSIPRDDAHDPHTGLLRRSRALTMLTQAKAALLLEIQGLTALRERLGYAGLESLLREAGRKLAALAPEAARLNDGTFLVLAAQDDARALTQLARTLRDAMGRPLEQDGQAIRLRAAVAHGALVDVGNDPLGALERALREARNEPAGIAAAQAVVPPAHDADSLAALREGMEQGRLELAFQPIASVAGGNESQFQVLLRMRDAQQRIYSAAELVARAQTAGVLHEVDRRVLELALTLLDRSATPQGPTRLFVSQSPQAVAADPAGSWLQQALAERGVEPGALVIDLRLDDALVHGLALADFCNKLAPLGVRFCLGQYAHSDEADALLRELPLSYLRLSTRYSQQDHDPALREELRTLIAAAHARNMQVIGSQVETPAAAAALWMSGIDYIQGNLVQGAGSRLDFDFHHSVL
jgi:EAL domain-containing protein (putative c-di-GMP-specific phosphodiesterase class I)/DNA-binding response OmpR family regulator